MPPLVTAPDDVLLVISLTLNYRSTLLLLFLFASLASPSTPTSLVSASLVSAFPLLADYTWHLHLHLLLFSKQASVAWCCLGGRLAHQAL